MSPDAAAITVEARAAAAARLGVGDSLSSSLAHFGQALIQKCGSEAM
jgi:hypothetical protein